MTARRSFLVVALGALSGCGFRPLLGKTDSIEVQEQLAAIEIVGLQGRLGQLVRNALQDELNPTAAQIEPRYRLVISLRRRAAALGIQLDNTITRYNLALTARFQLLDRGESTPLYSSTVQRIASFNVRRAPYATLIAEQDAEKRAAREVSNDIRTLLAAQFALGTIDV